MVMSFWRLAVICLAGLVVIVLGISVSGSNIEAEEESFLNESSLVVTTLATGLEQKQIPVSIAGGQECFYDQRFVSRPEKRKTPLNLTGQEESSYISCGVDTPYGTKDQSGRLTRLGTNVSGKIYLKDSGSQTEFGHVTIPNSDFAFEYFRKSTPGGYLKLHSNISQKLETKVTPKTGEVKHYFNGTGGQFIVDRAGDKISKSYGDNYSTSGQWMVFDSNLGILRLDTTTGEYKVFAERFTSSSSWDPSYEFAISNDGRYIVVIKNRFSSAKLYDLNTCQGDEALDVPLDCEYKDLNKLLQRLDPKEAATRVVRAVFTDDKSLKFYHGLTKANGEVERQLQLLSVGEPVLLNYLGMGDSFAAGEGAYRYKSGTDVTTPLNKCHSSLASYPLLIGETLGSNSYNSVACSGAKIQDIYSVDEKYYNEELSQAKGKRFEGSDPEVLNNFLPGYRIQENFVAKYKPRTLTISVGGNDIGFGKLITRCTLLAEDCLSRERERADMAKLINDQYQDLVTTYQRLKSQAAGGTIYVVGYPQITSEDADCGVNARLSKEELLVLSPLLKYFNSVIEKATKRAGVVYVDASEALAGHRLCEGGNNAMAVNGLTHGNDKFFDVGPAANESYHPNILGQKLYETKILAETKNLSLVNPPADLAEADPKIEDAFELMEVEVVDYSQPLFDFRNMLQPVLFLGKPAAVSASGFAPSSNTKAWLTSEPYQLGEFTADETGNVNFNLGLGDDAPLGLHTLHLAGVNVAGEEIEHLQTVFVGSTEEDLDGDGTLNQNESCLVGEPSGIDTDLDGVDDACDGLIGQPPVGNPEAGDDNKAPPDTILGVNPSTNQAPSNSSSLQPNAGQTQNAGGNLQTGGGVQTGGDSTVNNLLNQGRLPTGPLSVDVAGASSESSTSPANNPPPARPSGFNPLPALLILAILAVILFIAYRRQKKLAPAESTEEILEPQALAAPAKPKKDKKKKSKKKPHHH